MSKSDIILQDIRFYVAKAVETKGELRSYHDDQVNSLLTKLLLNIYYEEEEENGNYERNDHERL